MFKILKASFVLLTTMIICSQYSYALTLTSPDIVPNGTISPKYTFNNYGCKGQNISPELKWKDIPNGTKSFAVTVYDPDAPTGSGWWHWMVVNIPTNYTSLPANFGKSDRFNLKDGIIQVHNDFGIHMYGGPCPPVGDKPHKYVFTVYALKVEKLDVLDSATTASIGFMIYGNTIEKNNFSGFHGR